MGVAQNSTGGVTQVLVHVCTYQGSILVPVLLSRSQIDPSPREAEAVAEQRHRGLDVGGRLYGPHRVFRQHHAVPGGHLQVVSAVWKWQGWEGRNRWFLTRPGGPQVCRRDSNRLGPNPLGLAVPCLDFGSHGYVRAENGDLDQQNCGFPFGVPGQVPSLFFFKRRSQQGPVLATRHICFVAFVLFHYIFPAQPTFSLFSGQVPPYTCFFIPISPPPKKKGK